MTVNDDVFPMKCFLRGLAAAYYDKSIKQIFAERKKDSKKLNYLNITNKEQEQCRKKKSIQQ